MSKKMFGLCIGLLLGMMLSTMVSAQDLVDAADNGDLSLVKNLLDKKSDPNEVDAFGNTALNKASKNGYLEVVKELISRGADVNKQNTFSISPLISATEFEQADVVKMLLKNGADINQEDFLKRTALSIAIEKGYAEIEKILKGENLDPKGVELIKACQNNDLNAVQKLLDQGTDPNVQDEQKRTPLHYAAEHGNSEIIELLFSKDAEPDVYNIDGNAPLHLAVLNDRLDAVKELLENGADPDVQNEDGNTPLHLAASIGNLEIIKELLEDGADPDEQNDDGKTPADLASESEKGEIEEILAKESAIKALFKACIGGDLAAVQAMLAKGTDSLDKTDEDGRTLLHWACVNGYAKIAKMLLDAGADPDVHDEKGMTPLHWASAKGHLDVVEELLENAKVDPNVQDDEGFTSLRYAAALPLLDVLNTLVKNDQLDPNVPDNNGMTPLHWASINNRLDVVKALLSSPEINLDVQDTILGNTALHYASAKGLLDIVQALYDHGAASDIENKLLQMPDESTDNEEIKKLLSAQEQEPLQLLKDCTIIKVPSSNNLIVETAGLKIQRDINPKASPFMLQDNGTITDNIHPTKLWEIKMENNNILLKVKSDFVAQDKLGQTLAKRLNPALEIFELFPILYDLAYPTSIDLVIGNLPILPIVGLADQEYALTKNRFTKHLGVTRSLVDGNWFIVFRPMEYIEQGAGRSVGVPGQNGYVYDSVNQRCWKMGIASDNSIFLDYQGEHVAKANVADNIKNIDLESAFDIFNDYPMIITLSTSDAICNLCMQAAQDALSGQTFSAANIVKFIESLILKLEKLPSRWTGRNIDSQEVSDYIAHIADHLKNKDIQKMLIDLDGQKDKAWQVAMKNRAREAKPLEEAKKLDQIFSEKNDIKKKIITNDSDQIKYEIEKWKVDLQLAEDALQKKDEQLKKRAEDSAKVKKMSERIQTLKAAKKTLSIPALASLPTPTPKPNEFENKLIQLKASLGKLKVSLATLQNKIITIQKNIASGAA